MLWPYFSRRSVPPGPSACAAVILIRAKGGKEVAVRLAGRQKESQYGHWSIRFHGPSVGRQICYRIERRDIGSKKQEERRVWTRDPRDRGSVFQMGGGRREKEA